MEYSYLSVLTLMLMNKSIVLQFKAHHQRILIQIIRPDFNNPNSYGIRTIEAILKARASLIKAGLLTFSGY